MLWTLAEAFDFYTQQGHYSNCFLTTSLAIGSGFQNLGVASIKSALSNGSGLQKNSSDVVSANEPSVELTPDNSAIDVST